ncbi:hypothetical protein [Helicobacter pylori]|uniref:hypothetical protein n=1 Tax=Helicobacter pylori TaxID=210 RepID=UPI000BBB16E5|nr:hypothetical protein [Helicobacter pylori]
MSEKPTIKKGIRGYKRASKQTLLYTPPKEFPFIPLSQNPPKNRKITRAKPLKPLRKFKILSFRGVFLKNLGFL